MGNFTMPAFTKGYLAMPNEHEKGMIQNALHQRGANRSERFFVVVIYKKRVVLGANDLMSEAEWRERRRRLKEQGPLR